MWNAGTERLWRGPPGGPDEWSVPRDVVWHAYQLAREVSARAVMVYADSMAGDDELRQLVGAADFPTVLVTRSGAAPPHPGSAAWVSVPDVRMGRAGQVKTALAARGGGHHRRHRRGGRLRLAVDRDGVRVQGRSPGRGHPAPGPRRAADRLIPGAGGPGPSV